MAEAWLHDRAPGFVEVTKTPGYAVWAFTHPVLRESLLELIDNPEISQGGAVVALSAKLWLRPPQNLEEAYGLLRLGEWLTGCAVVYKEITNEGDLMLEGKQSFLTKYTDTGDKAPDYSSIALSAKF